MMIYIGIANRKESLDMAQQFTKKQIKKAWFFIENKLSMTQLIYNTIMDGIMGLGKEVEPLIHRMIKEYPDFADMYKKQIDEEVAKANITPMPEEMSEHIWNNIQQKIKEYEARR